MKRVLLLAALLLAVCQIEARVIFVKAGNNGNGSSWANAMGDLQQAIKAAKAGDEIWVAQGKYQTTQGKDRNISFQVPNGVQLYGGFTGSESDLSQRDWENNLTMLTGEIGATTIDDNAYSVVYFRNVNNTTVLDGFVITGGTSNGTGAKGSKERCGAGIFNDGADGQSNPVIENCLFVNNYARDGAALYNFAKNGICEPLITNCQFVSNHADLDGGAIYNDGNYGKCNPKIRNCFFKDNEATYGAGILNQGDHGETRPLVANCVFAGNISYIRGSSIYNNRQDKGICEPVVSACRFSDNKSSVGREISSTVNNTGTKSRSEIVFRSGF